MVTPGWVLHLAEVRISSRSKKLQVCPHVDAASSDAERHIMTTQLKQQMQFHFLKAFLGNKRGYAKSRMKLTIINRQVFFCLFFLSQAQLFTRRDNDSFAYRYEMRLSVKQSMHLFTPPLGYLRHRDKHRGR